MLSPNCRAYSHWIAMSLKEEHVRFSRQLSLRGFGILGVAIALCLAYWCASARRQQEIANAITGLGGRVTYREPFGLIPRFIVTALGNDYFCAIDGITLYPTAESPADEQMTVLTDLPKLASLAIWPGASGLATGPTNPPGGLSDQGVDLLLKNHPDLRHLSLLAARITKDAELKLMQATNIESLQYQTHIAFGGRYGGRQ